MIKNTLLVAIALALAASIHAQAQEAKPTPALGKPATEQASRAAAGPDAHPIRFTGPLTNLREAPVIGNGDLAALVTVAQHEIVFQLGKNDVWDARKAERA